MKHFRFAFTFSLWTMLLFGATDAMRSATGPLLQAQTHITYAQLGNLFAASSIGYLLGSLPSGFVIQRVGLKRTILSGSLVMGAMLIIVSFSHLYIVLWGLFFLFGLASGWLEIGVNAVIPAIAASPRAESSGFNLLHGFYGVGATIFPALVIWLATRSGAWETPFLFAGITIMLAAFAIVGCRYPVISAPAEAQTKLPKQSREHQAMSSPLFYTLMFALMLYVLAEIGTATWLPTYLVHANGMSVTRSSWYLTGFYFVFTIGRLSGPLWVHRLGSYPSIVWSSIFSLILFGLGLWVHRDPFLFIISGFGFAVTFPTIVHIASQAFAKETGRVLGLLFTGAGVGSILVSWLIGELATKWSIQTAFWLIPIALVLVLIATVTAKILGRSHRQPISTSVPPASL